MENATNKTMKKVIFSITIVLLIICISNIPLVSFFIGSNDCQFSNSDGSFTFAEVNFKGADFRLCQENFVEFKKRKLGDTVPYRLCPKNVLHFWDFGQYIFSPKYRVQYKSWEEIQSRRGVLSNKSGFQDF